ncbi:hypothetical protein LWI28_024012 [Acer negundo]|uniref:Uncharacterized protein n=1 Tax=Acer negundo TaxID=4023 RepID=A0AAD5NZ08_ACENE|nr:hypothetical protein LWI28_024012 [Acer negundo]
MMEQLPNLNTPVGDANAPAPASRDGVKGVALGRPGGRRPPRAARHVQFEDFSDGDSNEDFAAYHIEERSKLTVPNKPSKVEKQSSLTVTEDVTEVVTDVTENVTEDVTEVATEVVTEVVTNVKGATDTHVLVVKHLVAEEEKTLAVVVLRKYSRCS